MMTKAEASLLQGVLTALIKQPREGLIKSLDTYVNEEIDDTYLNNIEQVLKDELIK